MQDVPGTAPAGWYPDPEGSSEQRYWDGMEWIELDGDVEDPAGAGPGTYRRFPGPGEEPEGQNAHVPARKPARSVQILVTSAVVVLSLVAAGAVLNPAKMTQSFVLDVVAGIVGDESSKAEAVRPRPKPTLPAREQSPYAPTPGHEASSSRLLPRVSVKVSSDSYKFLPGGTGGQAFVAYDPCRPVHYVVRAANAPAGGLAMIKAGFAGLSRATGLKFVYDGPTKEAPSRTRKPFQPGVYGDRWAPVLVAWTSVKEYPQMAPRNTAEGTQLKLGEAGSGSMPAEDGRQVYVTGQVALNAPALAETAAYEGQTAIYGETIAHELAHLVGEDHVNDPEQLMYPVRDGHVTGYAPGDLSGLTRLGRGPCAPEL